MKYDYFNHRDFIFTHFPVNSLWVKNDTKKTGFIQFILIYRGTKINWKVKQIMRSHIMGVFHFCYFASILLCYITFF